MRLRNKTKLVTLATASLFMAALLLSSACAGAPRAPGEKSVKLGYIAFSTGPVADVGLPVTKNACDYVEWVNAHGGIDGVKVDFKWIDTAQEIPRGISAYQRLKEWGALAIWCFSTNVNDAIRKMANEDGIPILSFAGGAELFWPVNFYFSCWQSYTDEGRFGPLWLMKHGPGLPKRPRVGMLYTDDSFGWTHVYGLQHYQDVDGYEPVAHAFLPHGALDATTQVKQLMDAKPDIVTMTYTPTTASVIVRDMVRLGLKARVIATPQAQDDRLGPLSEGAAESDQFYWLAYHHRMQERCPGMEPIANMVRARHPGVDPYNPSPVGMWEQGIVGPHVMMEGARAAIKQFGYENLTRANMRKGLESLKNLNIYDFMTVNYSPDDHRGNPNMAVYQYKQGRFKLVGDFEPSPKPADWEKQGKFKWAK